MGATGMAEAGRWLRGLCELAQGWLRDEGGLVCWVERRGRAVRTDESNWTDAYADFVFAFGLARLGARESSEELVRRAQDCLAGADEAHRLLLDAYRFRIAEELAGRPHQGAL